MSMTSRIRTTLLSAVLVTCAAVAPAAHAASDWYGPRVEAAETADAGPTATRGDVSRGISGRGRATRAGSDWY